MEKLYKQYLKNPETFEKIKKLEPKGRFHFGVIMFCINFNNKNNKCKI